MSVQSKLETLIQSIKVSRPCIHIRITIRDLSSAHRDNVPELGIEMPDDTMGSGVFGTINAYRVTSS